MRRKIILDLVDLRKENIRLLQKIDSMKEKEKDYQAQIDKVINFLLFSSKLNQKN